MPNLALLGGPRTIDRETATSWKQPLVSETGIRRVVELMRAGEISRSPIVDEFEGRFAAYIGIEYALAVANGTAALSCALFAAGIGPGDEVIVPSYTFRSSAATIRLAGATAVFCDVSRDTYNIDPEDAARRTTERTKAIIPVDCWGNPADIDAVLTLAKEHNLVVIDDACQAHGATWNGARVGSHADISCFSLQASKMLVGGEGGVLVTNNRDYYERAVAFGRSLKLRDLPDDSPWKPFWLTGFGSKYRPHPLAIAIASDGLDRLDERNEVVWENARYLEDGLRDIRCLAPQAVYQRARRIYAYHYFTYDEDAVDGVSLATFIRALAAEGVRVGKCGFGRLHEAPLFFQEGLYGTDHPDWRPSARVSLGVTEHLRDHTFLGAPRFETSELRSLVDLYVEAYSKVADNVDELKQHEVSEPVAEEAQVSGLSIDVVER